MNQRAAHGMDDRWVPPSLPPIDNSGAILRARVDAAIAHVNGGLEAAVNAAGQMAGGGMVGRHRTRTLHLVDADPARPRWARVPVGRTTCAFCLLLASRGFEYTSASAAGAEVKFHAGCDCAVVPSWGKTPLAVEGYDPDKLYELYEAAQRGRTGEPFASDLTEIAARFRRMYPHMVTDAVEEGKPRKTRSDKGKKRNLNAMTPDGSYALATHRKLVKAARADYAALGSVARQAGKFLVPDEPALPPQWWNAEGSGLPLLRAKEWNHILYGDISKKGGHLHGYAWRHGARRGGGTVTEFPPEWGSDTIAQAMAHVLKNGQRVGNKTTVGTYRGVRVKTHFEARGKSTRILTAYPVGE